MATKLVQQRADISVGTKEDGQERLGVQLRDQDQAAVELYDAGAKPSALSCVTELATRFSDGGNQGRQPIDVETVARMRVDRKPITAGDDNRIYAGPAA